MNKTRTILLLIAVFLLIPASLTSQIIIKNMLIYEKGGKITSIPVNQIEKIVFDGPQIEMANNVVRDVDGNIYNIVKIGHQVWTASNLKTTKYNDGTPIKNIIENDVWAKLREGAYCWYMNNSDNKEALGALYNWYAVNTGKLCPTGWHMPRKDEWRALSEYLLPNNADKLKVAGKIYWKKNLESATNESGFGAMPGGARQLDGSFHFEGAYGQWWSSDLGCEQSGDGALMYDNSIRMSIQGIYKVGAGLSTPGVIWYNAELQHNSTLGDLLM